MPWGFFRRSAKVALEVQLDRPQGPYYPGEVVRARILVRNEGGTVKIRGAEARLFLWQRYRQWVFIETDRDTEEDPTLFVDDEHWEPMWEEDVLHVAGRQPLPLPKRLPRGFQQVFQVAFRLPPQTAPGYQGTLAQGGWSLHVALDRPWAKDVRQSLLVPVVVPPPGVHTRTGLYGRISHPNVVAMQLELPGLEFVEGDTLTGSLLLKSHRPVEGREIRVVLEVREFIPSNSPAGPMENARPDFRETIEAARVVLRPAAALRPGESLRLPFRLEIPRLWRPTSATGGDGWIRWFLQGVVDRPRARDYRVEQELFVYNGR